MGQRNQHQSIHNSQLGETKHPNEPMRTYSKSNQVAQARKMSFSKCANMFSLRNGYVCYSKFVVDFL